MSSGRANEKDPNACDCGHAVWWHNDTRGCGYKGFDPRHKCPCPLLAHEAVDAVVTRERAQAWQEGAIWALRDQGHSVDAFVRAALIDRNPHLIPPGSATGGGS